MGLIMWLIVGGIVGWLASIIMKTNEQQGIVLNVAVGNRRLVPGRARGRAFDQRRDQRSRAFSSSLDRRGRAARAGQSDPPRPRPLTRFPSVGES